MRTMANDKKYHVHSGRAPTDTLRLRRATSTRLTGSSRSRSTMTKTFRRTRMRADGAAEAHVNTRFGDEAGGKARWTPKEFLLGHTVGQFVMLFIIAVVLVFAGMFAWVFASSWTGRGRAKTADYNASFIEALWFSWGIFFDPGTQTGLRADEFLGPKVVAVVFSILGFIFNLVLLGLIVERVKIFLDRMVETYGKVVRRGHVLALYPRGEFLGRFLGRAAATPRPWKCRGEASRRRRGRDVDSPWRRNRGAAAAATVDMPRRSIAAPPWPRRG